MEEPVSLSPLEHVRVILVDHGLSTVFGCRLPPSNCLGSPPSSPLPHAEGLEQQRIISASNRSRAIVVIASIIQQREIGRPLFFQHHARVFFSLIGGSGLLGRLLGLLGLLLILSLLLFY